MRCPCACASASATAITLGKSAVRPASVLRSAMSSRRSNRRENGAGPVDRATKAGLARARAQGRIGGRPRKHLPLIEVALKMLGAGASYDDVRKRYGVPASTLRRYRAVLKSHARQDASL